MVNGELPLDVNARGYRFVKTFGQSMRDIHLTHSTLQLFDIDFDVFENKLPNFTKPEKKK
jgi:hypothetical protein